MKYLIISLLSVVVFSCASYPKKIGLKSVSDTNFEIYKNKFFSNSQSDYTYRANIQVHAKSLTGILIVKKLGLNHHRVVFTTEMGNTIFDFSFINEDFKVNAIVEDLDNFFVLNILKNDFGVLVKDNHKFSKAYISDGFSILKTSHNKKRYYYYFEEELLQKIVRIGNNKEKVKIEFDGQHHFISETIKIDHSNIKLNISLKQF